MKILLTIAAMAVSVLGIANPAMSQKRDLIVAASQADAGKLDPHQAPAGADKGLLNWVFNGLVRIRPGQATPEAIEPDLAESWTANPNGTEWTFKLRTGVQCHGDFGEFTSDDAAFSLRRAGTAATSAFANDFSAFDRIEAVDKYTVKIVLKSPIPSLLGLVSNYHGGLMVCRRAVEQLGDGFALRPIGTGPFAFAEYRPQQFVRLVANRAYFRGVPQLDSITYRYIASDATRDLAFRAGEIDMMFGRQDNQWVDRTRSVPGAVVVAMEPAELNSIYLNTASKPLDDIRVRQAIAHAIDRRAMVRFSGDQVSREATSVVPIGNLGQADVGLLPFDQAKARALLTEAGYPNGVTLKVVQSTLPVLMRLMEALQAQLRQVGINLDIEPVDHPTYHANIRKNLSQVVLYQAARFPVADVYLTQFFHSRSIVGTPTAVTNFTHCRSADADIDAAKIETNIEKQKEFWRAAQEKLVRDVCAVPFSETLVVWAWKDTLDFGSEMKGSLNLVPQVTEKTRFTR